MKLSSIVQICSLPAASAFHMSMGEGQLPTRAHENAPPPTTRRSFIASAATSSGLVASSSAAGWFASGGTAEHGPGCGCDGCSGRGPGHGPGCACGACAGAGLGHGGGCACGGCARYGPGRGLCVRFGPDAAAAYEERNVGGENRSADTAALNIQAKETNARLEASGFKLDTREEEKARLSEGLASFSYDANASSGKKGPRGYAPSAPSKQNK